MDSTVRNRKMQGTMKEGMSRLESAMSDSVLRFRLMPSRAKFVIFLSGILSVFFYLYLGHWVFATDSDKALESLLDTEKCPACFGYSACGLLYNKQLKLSGTSRYRLLDMINGKNVHFGLLEYDDREVVLKKLATDTELKATDKMLCEDAKRQEGCDIARVIVRTDIGAPLFKGDLTPKILEKTGGFMFYCPSYRLVDRMWNYFQEFKKKNDIFVSDKMQVLYTGFVNPEPLILQTFPKHQGWPFPEYIGACGRVVVEEHAGKTLSEFFNAPFPVRAALAYQLMQIAETLSTKSDFALYLTDVSFENFAVDSSGKVTVIDLENIIVVDTLAIKARKPRGWDEPHEAMFSECEGKNCLMFSTQDLCSRVKSDHNYNAICRNLLSHYANENGLVGGLLHDMPVSANDFWDLGNLLEECARPTDKEGRWRAKEKMMVALEDLKETRGSHTKINKKAKM
ncbi:divergent protein kinase domain 2A [Aplysia californica]|uniref:Divergent protein kinase domain 2A n=1 Tax=Aplysia californica TaxID=6500 RepID=A0ABM0K0P9_APLCA|nr:divergent protein kinase domain 2A [Aplysia californica]